MNRMNVSRKELRNNIDMSLDEALEMQSALKRENRRDIMWGIFSIFAVVASLMLVWNKHLLLGLIVGVIYVVLYLRRNSRLPVDLSIWFGLPGAGKSTLCAMMADKFAKFGKPVYSNFPVSGTYKLDPLEDLGKYHTPSGLYIIDEAGIDLTIQ